MIVAVDASAIVAILTSEAEADSLVHALAGASLATLSPVGLYEATLGVARVLRLSVADAEAAVLEFLKLSRITVAPITPEHAHAALAAFAQYGKGRGHPARLNLGDCFAYAQARLSGARLLYKGEDFAQTDVESAC